MDQGKGERRSRIGYQFVADHLAKGGVGGEHGRSALAEIVHHHGLLGPAFWQSGGYANVGGRARGGLHGMGREGRHCVQCAQRSTIV